MTVLAVSSTLQQVCWADLYWPVLNIRYLNFNTLNVHCVRLRRNSHFDYAFKVAKLFAQLWRDLHVLNVLQALMMNFDKKTHHIWTFHFA